MLRCYACIFLLSVSSSFLAGMNDYQDLRTNQQKNVPPVKSTPIPIKQSKSDDSYLIRLSPDNSAFSLWNAYGKSPETHSPKDSLR